MTAVGYVDLLIPRGGAGLIRACVENAKVPCIQTGTGICHIFVDDTADQTKALDIIENAKPAAPASATPRKSASSTAPLRANSCRSWPSASAPTAPPRVCTRWNCGWTSALPPHSPAPPPAEGLRHGVPRLHPCGENRGQRGGSHRPHRGSLHRPQRSHPDPD